MKERSVDRVDVKINFPISITISVVAIAAFLVFFYFTSTGSVEKTLLFSTAAFAAVGTILAAFYTARVLALNLEQDRNSRAEHMLLIELEKKKNAMGYGARWTNPQMQSSRKTCREIANMKGKSLKQISEFLSDEEKKSDVFHLLNFFEEIATAVGCGVADEQTLKELYEEPYSAVWNSLHLWLEQHKKKNGLVSAWDNLEILHKEWSRKTK